MKTKYELTTFFQPIVSVRRKTIIGYEALTRGMIPGHDIVISYESLYQEAQENGCLVEFDRACRFSALTAWKRFHPSEEGSLLFLNFDVSLLDMGVAGSGFFAQMVEKVGINPGNIVIELVERSLDNFEDLVSFVRAYRNRGFLIAIDDFGEGCSSVHRLAALGPDIIKISRSVFCAPSLSSIYRRSLLRGLVSWITSVGALPLLEGVETEAQFYEALDVGVDIIQGFFLAPPFEERDEGSSQRMYARIQEISSDAASYLLHRIEGINQRSRERIRRIHRLVKLLEGEREGFHLEKVLPSLIGEDPAIECLYLLNPEGIQISETYFRMPVSSKNSLYRPARPGDDLSEKEYYLHLKAGGNQYYSDPYISFATGSLCRTISVRLCQGPLAGCILCVDFLEEDLTS